MKKRQCLVINTYFKKREKSQTTYFSPQGTRKSKTKPKARKNKITKIQAEISEVET